MNSTNLHIYPSPFIYETRILKETKSLIDNNLVDQIIIASTWNSGLLEFEQIDQRRSVKRFRLKSIYFKNSLMTKVVQYFEFIVKVFYHFRRVNLDFINCHSLLVLPIGVLLKKYGKCQILIYDAHELETERVGLTGILQKGTKLLEKALIGYIDKMIVVSEPIAEWYMKEYNLKEVFVIKNMPYRIKLPISKPTLLKEKFEIPQEHILFIYQGLLMKGRGVDTLIEVFKNVPENKHIVFMGYGTSENMVKQVASTNKNIHFQPAVHPSEIIKYTSSADIGFNFITGQLCVSYQYSLPNKFGEYILSGIPVLVSSSLSYLSSVINENKCGWVLNSDNTDLLQNFIIQIDKVEIDKIAENVKVYSKKIGWELEENLFKKIYNKCLE
jgi:glycosyltransferase involved in cell wall biosynthesis